MLNRLFTDIFYLPVYIVKNKKNNIYREKAYLVTFTKEVEFDKVITCNPNSGYHDELVFVVRWKQSVHNLQIFIPMLDVTVFSIYGACMGLTSLRINLWHQHANPNYNPWLLDFSI